MIRSFEELNDILIDPINDINQGEREEIRTHSNSIISDSTVEIEDQEDRERGDNNSNYDEDFEEESPTKDAGAEYVEDYESDHTSISDQNLQENQSLISLPLAPSPPKKSETLDESKFPTIETLFLSPRAVRILKSDSERMSSPSNQNTDGNKIVNSPQTKQDDYNEESVEIPKPEISHPIEYTETDSTGSPSFPYAKTTVVSIGKSRYSRPKLFSRVSVVSSTTTPEIAQRRPTTLPTIPTTSAPLSSSDRNNNDMADIVRSILHEDHMKKLYAEELLRELQRRNAIPIPIPIPDGRQSRPPPPLPPTVESPAIRIPNYDRYYEICIEIQELVQRECEKEAKQRHILVGNRDNRTDNNNIDGVRSARRLQMDAMSFMKGSSHNVDCQTSERTDSSVRSSAISDASHSNGHSRHEGATVSSRRQTHRPPFRVGSAKASPKNSSPSSGSVQFIKCTSGEPAPYRNSLSSSSLRNGTPPAPSPSPSSTREDRSLSTKVTTEFSENYKKRSTVSSLQFSTTLPSSTTLSSSSSSASPPAVAAEDDHDHHDDDDVRSVDEFIDMMDKLRRDEPKIYDACNNIYSTFLSDLIGMLINGFTLLPYPFSLSFQSHQST